MARTAGKRLAKTSSASAVRKPLKKPAPKRNVKSDELVVLNVAVKPATRNGLNRLKSIFGVRNQAAVLDRLIKEALAQARK